MPTWQKITFALGLAVIISIIFGFVVTYTLYGITKLVLWYQARRRSTSS